MVIKIANRLGNFNIGKNFILRQKSEFFKPSRTGSETKASQVSSLRLLLNRQFTEKRRRERKVKCWDPPLNKFFGGELFSITNSTY